MPSTARFKDTDMKQFALQEFGKEFKCGISPLGMIKKWLREGILKWTNERQSTLPIGIEMRSMYIREIT
jgi:hypothetical protein